MTSSVGVRAVIALWGFVFFATPAHADLIYQVDYSMFNTAGGSGPVHLDITRLLEGLGVTIGKTEAIDPARQQGVVEFLFHCKGIAAGSGDRPQPPDVYAANDRGVLKWDMSSTLLPLAVHRNAIEVREFSGEKDPLPDERRDIAEKAMRLLTEMAPPDAADAPVQTVHPSMDDVLQMRIQLLEEAGLRRIEYTYAG